MITHKPTLIDLTINAVKKYDIMEDILFTKQKDGSYEGINRFQVLNYSFCIKDYLEKLGLRKNTCLAIISENRIEWVITDFACMFSGNISVPIYPSLSAESIKYILNDCKAEVVFVSTGLQLDKIISIKRECPDLKHIISFNGINSAKSKEKITTFSEIFCSKRSFSKNELLENLEKISDDVDGTDLLTIIYTSGTTGLPKGVMLMHKNIYANLITFPEVLHINENYKFLSYLPYSHIYERTAGYYLPFSGVQKFIMRKALIQ